MLKDYPSDVVVEKGLVECKVRGVEIDAQGHRYIRLDLDWLPKVEKEADRMGFEWAVVVINPKNSKYPYVLHRLDFFLELLKASVEKS
jgi:hypothetical protein